MHMPKRTLTHTESHTLSPDTDIHTHTRKHTRTHADNLHMDIHFDTQKHKQTITHTQTPLLRTLAATSAQATSESARAKKNGEPVNRYAVHRSEQATREIEQPASTVGKGELRTQKTSTE